MPSLSARLLSLVLRLSGRRRKFADAALPLVRLVATRPAEDRPSQSVRRRLRVDWHVHEGCEVYTLAPRTGKTTGRALYVHGGAYIYGITPQHWGFLARMVDETGLTFTVPLYPLAPGADCAEASHAVTAVYRTLLEDGARGPLAVMGDSAGGGLALSLVMQWRDAGLPLPGRVVLLSPWLDVTMSEPAQAAIEPSDVMLMRPGLALAGRWYANDLDVEDPRVSPLFGDLAGLPPILMFCGSHDMLVVDARRLAERARREGGRGANGTAPDVTYHEEPGLMHVYALLPVPEGRAARQRIAAFLREAQGLPVPFRSVTERPRAAIRATGSAGERA
ncbi:alpha/beta hydrolase fold domain-containing protein [Methylorubrum rhodesianum]|uniref:alpha/beta hydrolase fold domain-containing protein n=1 Tax=Methylorubrum rhodesianum TaxID=29427 RepID=UPI003CFE7E8C